MLNERKTWQEIEKFYDENPGQTFGGEELEDILYNFLDTGKSIVDAPTIQIPQMSFRCHKMTDGGVIRLRGSQQI